MDKDNKLSNLAGNPFGTFSKDELKGKLTTMKKADLISFARKCGVEANQQQIIQEIKANILAAFERDPRAVDILKMPRPHKFNLDFSDAKIQRLFNV